jgi:O-antigen ligase
MNALTLAAWCAAIFLAADLFSHTVALRLIALGVGVVSIFVALIQERLRKAPPSFDPVPPLWIPFALWGAWAGLSYFWSVEPARTAKEFTNEIVYTALAFWMCWCAAQAKGAARIIPPTVALAALGACASAIYFYFEKDINLYPYGPHGGAGNHSSALILMMPCVAAAGWIASSKRRTWMLPASLWLLAAVFLLSGYTTLNRMFWLVIAMQFVVLGGLLVARAHKFRLLTISSRVVFAAGLAAVAIMAAGASMMLRIQQERVDAQVAAGLMRDPRLALWSEVVERIGERPVLGYGFGRGMLRTALRKDLHDGSLWHSHNLALDAALQTGMVGLLLLGALLILTLRRGWQLVYSHDRVAAACGVALVAVVLGMVMRNMTDVLWVRQVALLYWGTVGALLAFGAARTRPPLRAAPPARAG